MRLVSSTCTVPKPLVDYPAKSVTLPEPQHTSSSLTVLIVDDEEEELRYWGDLVRNLGKNYTVLTALDRESAHAICREHRVDCVLLDLDMPESGFDLLLELVPDPKQPPIAVVVLTRLVYPTLCEIAKLHGAQDWLVKHQTSAELLDTAIQRAVLAVESGRHP
jgi:CheY-like chemotaxis protein